MYLYRLQCIYIHSEQLNPDFNEFSLHLFECTLSIITTEGFVKTYPSLLNLAQSARADLVLAIIVPDLMLNINISMTSPPKLPGLFR